MVVYYYTNVLESFDLAASPCCAWGQSRLDWEAGCGSVDRPEQLVIRKGMMSG